jgi:Major Facilitator Superfamily.
LLMFFISFNVLEGTLPSLISKTAPVDAKGTALGIYSTSQFLGAFAGGILGGWVYGLEGVAGVFILCAVLAGLWVAVAGGMAGPRYLKSHLLKVGPVDDNQGQALAERMRQVPGVVEAVVAEGTAYLKVDAQRLDEAALSKFSVQASEEK